MSRASDAGGNTQMPISRSGLDSLSETFHSVRLHDFDKPDSKGSLDLARSSSAPVPAVAAATPTSSSSSSGSVSAKPPTNAIPRFPNGNGVTGRRSHSGELTLDAIERNPRPGHRRSGSGPVAYSFGGGSTSSASSPVANLVPVGNICRSGRIAKPGPMAKISARSDVLGTGTGNYGHGSVVRGGAAAAGEVALGDLGVRKAMGSVDVEEVKRVGNEMYKRGKFAEALKLYDRAITMSKDNVACRSNRAAALVGLGRLGEAVKEYEAAVRLDPAYGRAHQRLAALLIRLAQVENARKHLSLAGQQADSVELQKLQAVERHLARCADARKIEDWKSALRESDAAVAAGADSSPLLLASRAEALLRLHQLDEANSALSSAFKLETSCPSVSSAKFFGFISNSYVNVVQAHVEVAWGRFENAIMAAEKAKQIDPGNVEVVMTLNSVRSVAKARIRGNELFNSGKFAEACIAYGEGLKYDPSNPVLLCNRAACRSKLGQWERSIEDCNEALRIQPNYTKALLRRAASNGKLERWAEAVRDYETLRKELPADTEVAEALFHAQVALKTSRGEEVSNMKFGGEVEKITGVEQFQAAISSPGASVVHFMVAQNEHCIQIAPFINGLCTRYPYVNFLKVDINESPTVAKTENVRAVPTFKIYKNGMRVKEMICPSHQVLEYSVRHYGL